MPKLVPIHPSREDAWKEDCAELRGRLLVGKHRHWCFDWDELPMDDTCLEWPCGCTEVERALA